jgi:hypothetical protein
MELRDSSQVDGKCQDDLLTLTQAEVGGFNKHARSAQIDGFTQLSAATRDSDIDNGSCTVPRVQAAFHLNRTSRLSNSCASRPEPLCRCSGLAPCTLQHIATQILGLQPAVGKWVMHCARPLSRIRALSEPDAVNHFTADNRWSVAANR